MRLKVYMSFGILLFLGLGCKDVSDQTPANFMYEIDALADEVSKKEYLELIFKKVQDVRQGDSEIVAKYGIDSEEYQAHIETMSIQDVENLAKIEYYLKKYGHPHKKEVGELAVVTPWAVIHHSGMYEDRERNFQMLHKAYLQKDLDEGKFSMFLDRMYRFKYGERLDMGSTYKEKDRIERLIKELKLN